MLFAKFFRAKHCLASAVFGIKGVILVVDLAVCCDSGCNLRHALLRRSTENSHMGVHSGFVPDLHSLGGHLPIPAARTSLYGSPPPPQVLLLQGAAAKLTSATTTSPQRGQSYSADAA